MPGTRFLSNRLRLEGLLPIVHLLAHDEEADPALRNKARGVERKGIHAVSLVIQCTQGGMQVAAAVGSEKSRDILQQHERRAALSQFAQNANETPKGR